LELIGLSLPGTFRKRRIWVFVGGVRVAWVAEVVLIIINMNKLQISLEQRESPDESTWLITYAEANRLLVLLRSDYFREIRLTGVSQVSAKELKFLIQIMRLLTPDVLLRLFRDNCCSTVRKTSS
jgi:hypothetical protein